MSKKVKRVYPIDVKDGYYARNETEYRFDKMMREHAKATGEGSMYEHLADQSVRNSLRRIDDKVDILTAKIDCLIAIMSEKDNADPQ